MNAIVSSLLRLSKIPLYVYITFCLSIHSSMDRHLGSLYLLAVVNIAARNIGVQMSVGGALGLPLILTLSPPVRGGLQLVAEQGCKADS